MKQSLNNCARIESVDALRGFAVMAIVLVHNLEHFIYPVYPTDPPAWLGRKRMFSDNGGDRDSTRTWTIILATAAVAFAPLYTLKELAMQTPGTAAQSAGTALDMWQKLAFTLVLVSAFMLSYRLSGRFRKSVSGLRWYGRMSLTNYICQSVAGALIYFPIGLNLAPYCGYTVSLLIGVAVFLLQVLLSRWWLSRHRQGPLETLWHKWTWLKLK